MDTRDKLAISPSVLEDPSREIWIVVRQALLMIVSFIELRYHLRGRVKQCPHCGERL